MMQFEDLGIKTKAGKQRYATTCPQCDKTRTKHQGALCLTVNDEPGNRWYKCHHCGWSGNLDVQDRYEGVRDKSRMPSKERVYTVKVRDYLKKRGISQGAAKSTGIYESQQMKDTLICFPYYMNLTLVNVKFFNMDYREGDKKPKWFQLPQDLGTRVLPLGMNLLKTHDEEGRRYAKNSLLITEGEWDMLTWKECGYNNVISVPQGAPSTKAKNFEKEFRYLQDKYVQSVLSDIEIFYLCVDDDEAGRLLRKHLSMILGKDKCRIIRYPTGYKDINEVFVGHEKKGLKPLGKKGVEECLQNASSVPIKGVIRASQVREELQILREGGFKPGLGCGIPEIDYLFTLKPKHITFITGVPGSGKSVWTRWYLVELIKHNADLGLKWAMFTPENRPVSREYAKIAQALTGMSLEKGHKYSMSDEQYRKAMNFVEKHFLIISPDKYNHEPFEGVDPKKVNTIKSIQKYLIYLKKTENIFGYVIDAWNKIEHEQPKWQAETTFISEQLDRLIDFNAYWDVHSFVIVHPRKIEMSGENYKMPSLYDIKGSSAWKEKADIGILIHRYKMKKITHKMAMGMNLDIEDMDEDEKYIVMENAPTIIRTEKIRFEELGHENRVKMEMNNYGRFTICKNSKEAKPSPTPDERIESNIFNTNKNDDDDDLPF